MRNAEFGTGNGEGEMADDQCRMADDQWRMADGGQQMPRRSGPPTFPGCQKVGWSAPQKLVQPKWESPGRLTHGGTQEKAKDRRGSGAVAARGRPRSCQGTDSL